MSPLKSPLADHKRKSIPLSASSPSPKRTKLETLTDKPATNEPEEGQATDEEDEFSEEEELLSGYVPPLKDDINSNLGIQSPLPTYSPSKIHDIAQKTNLSKLTTNQIYIPQPPQSSSIIYNKIEGDVDYDECDNESPLEDLATARYANVDIIKNSIEQAIFNQDLSGVGGGEDDEPTKRNSFWDVI